MKKEPLRRLESIKDKQFCEIIPLLPKTQLCPDGIKRDGTLCYPRKMGRKPIIVRYIVNKCLIVTVEDLGVIDPKAVV